jgi:hypothetical protein
VGVRLDADRDPHEHRLHDPVVAGDAVEPGDLVERVEHHRADPGGHRLVQLGGRFVVAVQGDSLRRELGTQRDGQLATAAHVEREPFLGHPPGDLHGQERLGRVVHERRVAERRRVLGAAGPEVGLVHHEQGRAVLGRQLADVHPGEAHDAVGAALGAPRPDRGVQLVQFVRSGRSGPGGVAGQHDIGVPWTGGMRPHASTSVPVR